MATTSIYPLDKNREILKETVEDDDKTVKLALRLYSQQGDSIDIELEKKLPWFISRPVPHDVNRRVLAEEADSEGNIFKIVMCEEEGVLKEYFIQERLPKEEKEPPSKKMKIEEESTPSSSSSDKNIQMMIQKQQQKGDKWKNPPDELLLLLSKTLAKSVGSSKRLITVQRTDSLLEAWKKLEENSILSVPVLKQDNCYYGFLDLVDIVSWVINQVGEKSLDFQSDFTSLQVFRDAQVKDVMTYPISKKNVYRPFPENASLLSVIEELARGTHRVGIVNKLGELVSIVTQMDVLQFIYKNKSALEDLKEMKVEEMYLSSQYVMSVLDDEKVIDAFRLIKITKVGGIAVVDSNGKLIGNISASDLKLPSKRNISSWFKPAKKFVEGQDMVATNFTDTLEFVMFQLIHNRIHRIYVVNPSYEPIGLLSIRDVLSEIIRKPSI